ncbi:MAG: putative sporulation protein YtxC, partial [Clostridia bacterium]
KYEQDSIMRISMRILTVSKENNDFGKEILKELIYEYLQENKKMILEGVVLFRIKEYIETLDYIVELAVTSYLNLIQY